MTHRHLTTKDIFTARVVNFEAGDEQRFTLFPMASLPLQHLQLTAEKHMTSSDYKLHSHFNALHLHLYLHCMAFALAALRCTAFATYKLLPWHKDFECLQAWQALQACRFHV